MRGTSGPALDTGARSGLGHSRFDLPYGPIGDSQVLPDYLYRRHEGVSIGKFMAKRYGVRWAE
jgi:hypothetical protein